VTIAPSVAEAVQYAGGWLFDQVMDGWDVTVLTPDHADPRPLQILGARGSDLEYALTRFTRVACLRTIALRAELYRQDERIRQMVLDNAGDGHAEVRLWGEEWPAVTEPPAGTIRHRLSNAARAFKSHALLAAQSGVSGRPVGPAGPVGETEVFHRFRTAALGQQAGPPAVAMLS
jgi:hypothetical protein